MFFAKKLVYGVMCFAAMSAVVDAQAASASLYVQDGLVACWDGIENAGVGVHNPSATVWKDLVGGYEFALTGVTVNDDRMTFAGSTSSYGTLSAADTTSSFVVASNGTMEIVYRSDTGAGIQVLLQSTDNSGLGFGIFNGNNIILRSSSSTAAQMLPFTSGANTNCVSVFYTSRAPVSAVVNGGKMALSGNNYWGSPGTTTVIGKRASNASGFLGSIYCIRLYNRHLSDEEIAANYEIDQKRFIFQVDESTIQVTSSVEGIASSPSPAYGLVSGLSAGAAVPATCGHTEVTNSNGSVYSCTGWKLYDENDAVVSSGTGSAFTYVHPTPAAYRKLEWQWEITSPPTRYVQDGLIACWDGIENAGAGVHEDNVAVWKSIVGGYEFTLTNVTVDANCMTFAGDNTSYGTLSATDTASTFLAAKSGTLEIVYRSRTGTGSQVIMQSTGAAGMAFSIWDGSKILPYTSSSQAAQLSFSFTSGTETNLVAVRYVSGAPVTAIANGSALSPANASTWASPGSETIIGNRHTKASANSFPGSIYAIRLYDRQLTDPEILANQSIDRQRFSPEVDNSRLVVSGTLAGVGAPSPAYGYLTGLEAGDTRSVTCGTTPWTNTAENAVYVCTGWKLYDKNDNVVSCGTETTFTYEHPSQAAYRRLEWQWGKLLTILPIPDQFNETFDPCRPELIVSNQVNGTTWTVGGDRSSPYFDVAYTNNFGAGTATATVTGKGDFDSIILRQAFNIFATKLEDDNISTTDVSARRHEAAGKYVYVFTNAAAAQASTVKRNLAMTDYLVVGGGGGGGNAMGGGGGGGGVTNATGIVRALLSKGDTFTVSVGAGGAGAGSYTRQGANGKATSFQFGNISVSVAGGGGGGSTFSKVGAAGASGGGGSLSGAGGAGIDGIGYAGATGGGDSSRAGGGGGGAGHEGYPYTADPKRAGNGGEGIVSSITGEAVYYGGGGGGGADTCDPGFGGLGGGGDGKKKAAGQPGADGFGGGGGGGSWLGVNTDSRNCGGNGGSGTVILALQPGDFNIEPIADQYLDVGAGGGCTPEPVVRTSDGVTLLTKDVDYTISYTGNTQSGNAILTVTGINDYAGKVCEISFKIYRRYFVDDDAEQEGDGSEVSPFKTISYSIEQANAAIAGGAQLVAIHAEDGEYPERGLTVSNPIVIEGNASDRTAVKIGTTGGRVLLVENANAVLRNLTVRNGQSQYLESNVAAGGNIRLNAGVVTNCVITGATVNGNDRAGANLFVAGGTVVDCLIDGSTGARNTKGQGVYMTGGSVVRCRIVNQVAGSDTGAPTLGVGAYLTGGIIEDCLIAGNASGIAALYMNGGTAVNCTIAGNTAKVSGKCVGTYVNNNAASVVNCVVFGNGGTALTEWGDNDKGARFFNCASSAEIAGGTDCVTLQSSSYLSYFEDNVSWIPFAGSPMMDAGDFTRYLSAYSQTDLAGNARVRPEGVSIDIGCYEVDQDSFSFAPTMVSYPSILSGGTVDFVMLVVGAAGTVTFEIDFGDGSENLVTTSSSFSRQFNTAGYFHVRARAKVGSEAYGEWVDIVQPIRVSNADIYVSDADGNDDNAGTVAAPLKTVTKALNTLTNLLSKCETDVDGVTIHVAAGTYLENALPKISSAVTIEGSASDRTAAKIGKTGGRVFLVENANAVLRNLTIQNGQSNGGAGAAAAGGNIRLNAGVVTNCVISGGHFDTKDRVGANLYVTGGTVVDCLIDGSTGYRNTMGHGVYMTGGSVVRCRIVNQVTGNDTGALSLGVGAYVTGGIIENCLIAGNTSGTGALFISGGKAVNCTIAGNTARVAGKCIGVHVNNSAASVVNCVIYGNDDNSATANFGTSNLNRFFYCGSSVTNASCATWTVLSDADFVSVVNGNWHQRGSSQLTDRGTVDTTYRPANCSTLDLDGNPRLLNKSVDLGCWEMQASLGFQIIVR